MADTNIGTYENSQQDGRPLECYKFNLNGTDYLYTSASRDIDVVYTDNGVTSTETYFSDYITRETIKPNSKGSTAALVVTVPKDNVIAKAYQGPPPETPVTLKVLRLHEQDHTKLDIIFTGRIAQGSFINSSCELTVKMEGYMSKEIPNGKRQFTCGNVIYDKKCRLKESDLTVNAYIDSINGLNIYSSTFAKYADNYFVGGVIRYKSSIRQVSLHVGNRIRLKYPFIETPSADITIAPGCDHLFKTCAIKFKNTLNFTGCPYVPPANPEHTAVGRGVYWVDSLVIQRDTDGFIGTIEI